MRIGVIARTAKRVFRKSRKFGVGIPNWEVQEPIQYWGDGGDVTPDSHYGNEKLDFVRMNNLPRWVLGYGKDVAGMKDVFAQEVALELSSANDPLLHNIDERFNIWNDRSAVISQDFSSRDVVITSLTGNGGEEVEAKWRYVGDMSKDPIAVSGSFFADEDFRDVYIDY